MGNERDEKYEGHEEGEYHFSDEQINYDEVETEPAKAGATTSAPLKQQVIEKFGQHRRIVIGVVVFFGLIFLVYKMLTPPAQTPATEFAQTTPQTASKPAATVASKAPKPLVPQATPQQPTPVAEMPHAMPQPSAQMVPNPLEAPPPSQAAAPSTPMPPQGGYNMPPSGQMVMNPGAAPPAPPTTMQPPAMMQQPAAAQGSSDQQNKMIMDRLASLEEQNAKFMNLVQTQFSQKMAEYESANAAAQEKIHNMNKKLGNMEASLNKMSELLQEQGIATKMPMAVGAAGLPPPRAAEPKMTYTVQAIIPGRAWLKSDAGDTVTVAEGDVLKDYGRITKIDPYDGVVDIDTGNKVLTLSYGSTGD